MSCGVIKVCLDFLETNNWVMLRSISGVQIWQKITEKPSKHNWRIGDWINDEIPLQATLRDNYYKALNISCYLIFDGKGYDNYFTQTT